MIADVLKNVSSSDLRLEKISQRAVRNKTAICKYIAFSNISAKLTVVSVFDKYWSTSAVASKTV